MTSSDYLGFYLVLGLDVPTYVGRQLVALLHCIRSL
jgi:hypothetical protein